MAVGSSPPGPRSSSSATSGAAPGASWRSTWPRCPRAEIPGARSGNDRSLRPVVAGMAAELGRYGIWARPDRATTELAREAERLGYGAVWVGGSPGELAAIEPLLDATETLVVATGIINMWQVSADEAATWFHRLEELHPGRFLLGLGIGHREATAEYRSPLATMVAYLDRLDADGVPADRRVLAALGPRVLGLAAERAAGAHPYLVPPEHSSTARE